MNYRSMADLSGHVLAWSSELPREIELIVGVPRSGLLVANLLALYLNRPMADLQGFIAGRILTSGPRCHVNDTGGFFSRERTVLIVDDSVSYGGEITRVKTAISSNRIPHRILYGAVYVSPQGRDGGYVDYFREVVPRPRVFEWNIMHHRSVLERACMGIEGVLCRPPSGLERCSNKKYRQYLEQAEPLHLPTHRVGRLVTARSERHRDVTERWLARHGVEYDHLVMLNGKEMHVNGANGSAASFQASVYRASDALLFIAGSAKEACWIARNAARSVFCMETWEMIAPGGVVSRHRRPSSRIERLCRNSYHEAARLHGAIRRRLGMQQRPHE